MLGYPDLGHQVLTGELKANKAMSHAIFISQCRCRFGLGLVAGVCHYSSLLVDLTLLAPSICAGTMLFFAVLV